MEAYVAITQRVDFVQGHDESRDCLDQKWMQFFAEINIIPIPIMNKMSDVFFDKLNKKITETYFIK